MNPPPSPPDFWAPPAALRLLQRWEFPRKLGLCERLFAPALARQGIRWVRTARGPVWKLDLNNATHRWMAYGYYEGPSLWRWLERNAATIGTIVDSGANIGQTVAGFAQLLPRARIFAYEPGREARQWLEDSVAANGFGMVTVRPAGLGAARGQAHLENVGAGGLHGSWNHVNPSKGEPIEIATLDEELDRHACAALDLWKLDVEGYELEALAGAARSLAAGRIRAVYVEIGQFGPESIAVLRQHGYTPWRLRDSGQPEPLQSYSSMENALFLAPGHPSAGSA
jgi:FkbM family methyltransferase